MFLSEIEFLRTILAGTCGMFDWTLFDNSNQTKVFRRPKKLGCSTQNMFDDKIDNKINSYFNFENWQLSNITLVELNQESDYVWLMLCLTNVMFNNGQKLYIFC